MMPFSHWRLTQACPMPAARCCHAGGLALASAVELSFNTAGFIAALLNNCVDCIQNVFSKKLLMGRYSYVELQFFTSAAALVVQIPIWIAWYHASILAWIIPSWAGAAGTIEEELAVPRLTFALVLLLDATSYHLQSVFAYALMELISPVTHSVANTVKRAVLIWLSVLFFGNPVSLLSVLGTGAVVGGVFLYNWAREKEFVAKASPTAEVRSPSSSPLALSPSPPAISSAVISDTGLATPRKTNSSSLRSAAPIIGMILC